VPGFFVSAVEGPAFEVHAEPKHHGTSTRRRGRQSSLRRQRQRLGDGGDLDALGLDHGDEVRRGADPQGLADRCDAVGIWLPRTQLTLDQLRLASSFLGSKASPKVPAAVSSAAAVRPP